MLLYVSEGAKPYQIRTHPIFRIVPLIKLAEVAEPFAAPLVHEVFPKLVQCLMVDICAERCVAHREFTSEALVLMRALPWRQNLGVLRDVIAQVMTTGQAGDVRLEELLEHVRINGDAGDAVTPVSYSTLKDARLRFERDYIRTVLERHGWRVSEAARTLGIQRTNLYRKARQLGILRGSVRTR